MAVAESTASPVISVVVCTYNRGRTLPAHLETVLEQDTDIYEAIYVNDGSSDETRQVLDQFAAKHPDKMRVLHTENQGPGPARNAGVAQARGTWLLFTDDDVQVPRNWVRGMLELGSLAGSDAVCGGIEPLTPDSECARYQQCRLIGALGKPGNMLRAAPMMNFLVRRERFDAIGGFRATPVPAAEDWDFCLRLRRAGATIRYRPGITVRHQYADTWPEVARRLRASGAMGPWLARSMQWPLPLYLGHGTARWLLSPLLVALRYPPALYGKALWMETVFWTARMRAAWYYLTGEALEDAVRRASR